MGKKVLALALSFLFLLFFWGSLKDVPNAIDHYRAGDVSGAVTTYVLVLLSASLMVVCWRWFRRLSQKPR